MIKQILLMCLMLLGVVLAQAQTTATTSGGEATGNGGTVSYTVGQVVYQTHSGTNGSVAEGVQQPYEISVVTGIEEAKGINLLVSAYPNPTTDYLTLEIKDFELSNLSFQLYDLNGKILQNKKITVSQTSIAMGNLIPANYFVTVMQNNKKIRTFKIIKK